MTPKYLVHLNCCRICGVTSKKMIDLFGKQKDQDSPAETIMRYTKLSIQQSDDRPMYICGKCDKKLKNVYEFCQMASNSEENFQQMILVQQMKPPEAVESVLVENEISTHNEANIFDSESGSEFIPLDSLVDIDYDIKSEHFDADINTGQSNDFEYSNENLENDKPSAHIERNTETEKTLFDDDERSNNASELEAFTQNETKSTIPQESSDTNEQKFPCEHGKCNKCFESAKQLTTHSKKKHPGFKPFKCTYCSIRFTRLSTVRNHMQSKHSVYNKKRKMREKNTKCDRCSKTFTTSQGLHGHMIRCHNLEKKAFECYKCREKFRIRSLLNKHLRKHITATPCQCTVCGMFYSENNIKHHLCEGKTVHCEYCTERGLYKTTLALLEHLETHPMNTIIMKKCLKCPKCFPAKYLLECHMQKHQIEASYACEICNQLYDSYNALKTHRSVHEKKKYLLCPKCGKSFKTQQQLKSHSVTHSGVKAFACPHCPKRLSNKRCLIRHLDTHNDAKYSCDQCDSILSTWVSLTSHKQKVHRETPFKTCEICSLKCSTSFNYKKHMLIHTGEKPHKCPYCEISYRQSGDLKRHLARLHVGDNIYQCDKCEKGFRLQKLLLKHSYEHYKQEQLSEKSHQQSAENV